MNLKQKTEPVIWPETHYVYIEKIGPFQNTAPQAWESLHKLVPAVLEHNKIIGFMSLYRVDPEMVYRAGVSVAAPPVNLPEGLSYTKFSGGKYTGFELVGSYSQLPEASGKVFNTVVEKKLPLRDDFFIENYVNDPRVTPEDQLITEILIPTK